MGCFCNHIRGIFDAGDKGRCTMPISGTTIIPYVVIKKLSENSNIQINTDCKPNKSIKIVG